MRILITTDTVGGVWTFARQLSSELLARGCHVALVSVGRAPSQAQKHSIHAHFASWGSQFQFASSAAPLEWMDENDRAYSEAAPLLLRVAKEFHADLILSSQYCFGALPFDGPRIVVAHSDVFSWAKACRKIGLFSSAWLNRYRSLAGEGLADADAVVAPSHWMLHALEENFQIPGEVHVIHNGRSIPHSPASSPRRLQAVSAGRIWDEGKNLQLLAGINLDVPLVIAGDTGDKSKHAAPSFGRARLVGQLSEEEILALYRQSSIYVCPSKYEPFGLAPLEAALCGCAVVANDIPSLREIWDDAALFFQDEGTLSAVLAELSQSDYALAMARRRSRWRASHFSARRMAAAYLELFRSVLSRGVRTYAA